MLDDNGLTWHLSAPADRELAARAVIEWDGVRRTASNRLRACGNDKCTLFLLDRSKNNSARWCSMSSCGNRLKARRYYDRQKNKVTPH
ncbi:CGNR zinc finger domain-containing protein [Streptomyces wuyuanensis]|uniref:CGNR zinc finger domain-containing protein n=1 Tax=Streptomyces wuyuanensis TaxID=1196353 RepID=A0A1H0EKJ2_9ACTN|nr:CGNR zinc finger domain-containing protein [Streptomyces wuyuanensis]SDN82882.1 CGNR zinc finger domain-containing protein [Streptomyces wuyuanensis]